MDKEKIKQAVTLFLEGIGEDTTREGFSGHAGPDCENV